MVEMWMEFEKALIDGTQFLHVQRGIIDSPRRLFGLS